MASTVNNLLTGTRTEGSNEHGQSSSSTWGSISGLMEGNINWMTLATNF